MHSSRFARDSQVTSVLPVNPPKMIMDRMITKCTLLFLTVLVTAPAIAQQEPSPAQGIDDVVWTWSKRCSGDHNLGVTVRLDGKVLYRGVLPICHSSRDTEDGCGVSLC